MKLEIKTADWRLKTADLPKSRGQTSEIKAKSRKQKVEMKGDRSVRDSGRMKVRNTD